MRDFRRWGKVRARHHVCSFSAVEPKELATPSVWRARDFLPCFCPLDASLTTPHSPHYCEVLTPPGNSGTKGLD